MTTQARTSITAWITVGLALVTLALSASVFGAKAERIDRIAEQQATLDRRIAFIENAVSTQSGDIRVIRVIVERFEQERKTQLQTKN
jgi:hypothetical protein